MKSYTPSQRARAGAELELRRRQATAAPYTKYQTDPESYARDVLGVAWWHKQAEIARSLITPPYRTLVKACHNVGKTHLGGGLVNWFFDSFAPSITLTTAPTARQVRALLWKEVRQQRRGRGGFPGPKMPRLEWGEHYFAHGFTATDGEAFQGHHGKNMFFLFDEAVGVDGVFWETTESMFAGEGHAWLAIFNPTDTSSQAYIEEESGNWHVISLSVLDHPNIAAELAGLPPPFPSAIRLARVDVLIRKWCRPIEGPHKISDIEWPPASGKWWRPGPIAESRLLGRWPSQATNSVWSDGLWQACATLVLPLSDSPIEIGCDVARFGDDYTAIHVRRGPTSLHHESVNGWSTVETAGRLKTLAGKYGGPIGMDPRQVLIKVDDDGVGGGVVDNRGDYSFVGLGGGEKAVDAESYPNRRSELWFSVAERAERGELSLAHLDADTLRELKRQAMAPLYSLDSDGRRVVEPKDKTKKRIKRSPDDMDALNIAYAPIVERKAQGVKLGVWRR
jgi:hypothetical protein